MKEGPNGQSRSQDERGHAEEGSQVKKGDLLLIIEAMKMENSIVSPSDAIVVKINVAVNDRVESTKALIILEKIEETENTSL